MQSKIINFGIGDKSKFKLYHLILSFPTDLELCGPL